MRDGTRVIRAGLPDFAQGEPFLPGPTFANPYHLAGDPSSSPYSYGRYHNPTWTHFEQALSELEDGTAVTLFLLRKGIMPESHRMTNAPVEKGNIQHPTP